MREKRRSKLLGLGFHFAFLLVFPVYIFLFIICIYFGWTIFRSCQGSGEPQSGVVSMWLCVVSDLVGWSGIVTDGVVAYPILGVDRHLRTTIIPSITVNHCSIVLTIKAT